MESKRKIPITDYCPTQGKDFTVYANYINDGFGNYKLGTITCPYKQLAKPCNYKPCPIRSKLKENL